ncbi:MAG: recombination mediator RecR [Pseudomonadota bacterium]|jgi:recombination protein RecR|nr:recombination mediator RecR [Alphaproteobacteria bacterium]
MNSAEIQRLIQLLSRLPGLGPRSGRRAALHLLQKKESHMAPLIEAISSAYDTIQICKSCFNLDSHTICSLCNDPKRDPHTLCIVESVSDLWAMERSNTYRGQYFVLGGNLSAIQGIGPDQLHLQPLIEKVQNTPFQEVIFALSATLDGQTTMHYVRERIAPYVVNISSLAHGVPVGGELDYLDDGTLSTALTHRYKVA